MQKREIFTLTVIFGVSLTTAVILYFTLSQFQRMCLSDIANMTRDEHANTCKLITDAKEACLYGCEQAWNIMLHLHGSLPNCSQTPLPFPSFAQLNPACEKYYPNNSATDCLFGATGSVQNFIGRFSNACNIERSCDTAVKAAVAIAATITGILTGVATWQRFSLWNRAKKPPRLLVNMDDHSSYTPLSN